MKINYKKLIGIIVITILVGSIFSFVIPGSMKYYDGLIKPFKVPGIVFPIVWFTLFVLMGISLYIVSESKSNDKDQSYLIYIIQLIVNSLWTLLFFGLKLNFLSFLWLVLLLVLVIVMIINFYKTNKLAGLLQIPYLLWLLFAGYLNFTIYLLN